MFAWEQIPTDKAYDSIHYFHPKTLLPRCQQETRIYMRVSRSEVIVNAL